MSTHSNTVVAARNTTRFTRLKRNGEKTGLIIFRSTCRPDVVPAHVIDLLRRRVSAHVEPDSNLTCGRLTTETRQRERIRPSVDKRGGGVVSPTTPHDAIAVAISFRTKKTRRLTTDHRSDRADCRNRVGTRREMEIGRVSAPIVRVAWATVRRWPVPIPTAKPCRPTMVSSLQ